MRRIGILTAGGDTPALNATIHGAVARANERRVSMVGILDGYSGLLDGHVPHVELNPLFASIPELDPHRGGTLLGASRTYVSADDTEVIERISSRLVRLNVDGLICIGGDGTINGMQAICDRIPCVLAPKTIDNDLGLNYIEEPNHWAKQAESEGDEPEYVKRSERPEIQLEEIINYATPGYATAVFVVVQSIQRIRTTAEGHRRIAIVEVMGRQSGYIAFGSVYGQPDLILIPEVPVCLDTIEQRVRELYELQHHAVIVVGEGIVDDQGHSLGAASASQDPAGNVRLSGAAECLKDALAQRLGEKFFRDHGVDQTADSGIFTRKVGHTQRGGRPIRFDRFWAAQLGGQAVDMLLHSQSNAVATLQWSPHAGFTLDSVDCNKLRDRWRIIHPRQIHPSFYDQQRFQPSRVGIDYLRQIFDNALGSEDVEHTLATIFANDNLTPFQSINVDVQKRTHFLSPGE